MTTEIEKLLTKTGREFSTARVAAMARSRGIGEEAVLEACRGLGLQTFTRAGSTWMQFTFTGHGMNDLDRAVHLPLQGAWR